VSQKDRGFESHPLRSIFWAGITTAIFFLLFVVVMALFPEVVVILSDPIVVTGFNALFVVSIALPIIQSIIRCVEAGGFGEEAKVQYAAAIQQGDEMLQSASEMVMLWWRDLFAAGQYLTSEAFVYAF
jgi:hypothetical protein